MPTVTKKPRDEWEIRDDIRTLERAQEIRKDPNRLKDVQNMIRKTREAENSILNMKTSGTTTRYSNPATRGTLPVPNSNERW